MHVYKKSLIFNIGTVVLLVEFLVLVSLGLFYIERFSWEIDRNLEASVRLPGQLMNKQLLKYESVSDIGVMQDLVGNEFLDAMVIGSDGRIYYAFDQSMVGNSLTEYPQQADNLTALIRTDKEIYKPNNVSVISITPLVAFPGAKPFFHVFVKASTHEAKAKKWRIAALFIFGSLFCICLTSAVIIDYTRRRVTRPLRELKQVADALRLDGRGFSFPVDRDDEIGDLAKSFDAMQTAIERTIKELKEANKVISQREQRLAAFIKAMPDIMFVLDMDGRYEDIYTPEETLLYKDTLELKGQLMHEVLPTPSADKFLEIIHECIETGTVQTLEYELPLQTGNTWFEARISRIGDKSEVQGTVWLVRDITYRKDMEQRLTKAKDDAEQVSQRLRELDETKSTLVSSVSHELRTPLTSLLGFSKLILKNFANHFWPLAKDNPKLLTKGSQIVENLNILIHEGNRLTRLINDVLDLNKIEMGYTEWNDQKVHPTELIHMAAQSASGQFDNNPQLELLTQTDEDLPDITVDIDRLLQVLLNLLTNAAKFTAKGSVTLSAHRPRPDTIRFEVSDTGPGIPFHEQERIFEIFHQAGHVGPADDKPNGAGLGLAISRDIINHYHGTIWVESKSGEGATFIIELPLT
ncbi:ATP-binding protein [Pseudodesulfovibrio piezophilus]|uniref:histidine kinase n=1 Tax=Pseudodesulfovibrio piezophilus (strain DSM 21447 / JCM 15486 / C1TLV30) TaxID=1322246 RepID=M1WW09_PSEP2|nr:ATP-binding protein [Pseudodesulfovibrio piezophilus]CCH48853.1 putative Histidine kinase [Pseudodesulfovibrio piezophilus C1TLV30]